MFPLRKSLLLPALIVSAGLLMATSCQVDRDYDIDPSNIDLSVSVLEDGVTIPLGSTEKISLGSLINAAGEGINDYISTGKDGELILTYNGSTSLNQQLADLKLSEMAVMDGVSFDEEFAYKLDFDASKFVINKQVFDLKYQFEGFDLVNVPTGSGGAIADGLSYNADLVQFKNLIEGNADLDLGNAIGSVGYETEVLDVTTIKEQAALSPIENITVTSEMVPDAIIPKSNVTIEVNSIELDERVTGLSNIKISPNAKMVVALKMKNVCFTEGNVIPDVTMDFSKILNVKGGSTINLSDLVLTNLNGWSAQKTLSVEGLAKTDYDGDFSFSEDVTVEGKVSVQNAMTTKTLVAAATNNLELAIEVSFTDLTVASADIALALDAIELSDEVSFGEFSEVNLPDMIDDVKAIYLDESKPMVLKIATKNLDVLKQKNLDYSFVLNFPEEFVVKGTNEANQLILSGELNGPVQQEIVIREIRPKVENRKLKLDSKITINATVTPKNIVIDSAKLPKSDDQDLAFEVTVDGAPVISDYLIIMGTVNESIELGDKMEIDASSLGDFSAVHVFPEGSPALQFDFSIPKIKGNSLTPGPEGVKITLPDILVFDASKLPANLNYNAADNSITLYNEFPAGISMPIKEIYAKPRTVAGKRKIISEYKVSGSISAYTAEPINQADLEATFGTDIGVTIEIPEIKVASIALDDKLSFDIDQRFNMIIRNIPEQLKSVDEVLLDDVYVNLSAEFKGLPESSSSQFVLDLDVTLPEFFSPNVIPIKGAIVNGKLTTTPVKLEKISNIVPDEAGEVKGGISIVGSISADGAKIDISQLGSEIQAKVNASIQNANGKIAISKASGVFSYDFDQESELSLSDLPAMLRDENVCLDLTNPLVNLDITTNLGIPMTANLELVPYRGDVPDAANTIIVENVELPYSATSAATDTKRYLIGKVNTSTDPDVIFINADLGGLIKQLPDKLQVKIHAGVQPTKQAILEPAATYTLDINYGVNVVLAFGKDFRFTTSTEVDLSSAKQIIELGDFGIKGKVVNDSPLQLDVEMTLLDDAGNTVPQSKSSTINVAGASTSDIEIYLSPSDRTKTVSKALLTIKVTAIPDVPVKESDCIQFLNLVAVAPEGIDYEMNK